MFSLAKTMSLVVSPLNLLQGQEVPEISERMLLAVFLVIVLLPLSTPQNFSLIMRV